MATFVPVSPNENEQREDTTKMNGAKYIGGVVGQWLVRWWGYVLVLVAVR